MFGGTTNNNTTGTSGFGTFGGGGTSAFGTRPSGFGGFGGGTTGATAPTPAFGSGGAGAFGQTNAAGTGTSAFGQPSGTTSAFGSGLFGAKPAAPAGAFGSTSTGPAATADMNTAPVTTGSSNPPYVAYTEKDPATGGPSSVTLHYQSISMMPAYRGTSFEEVRVQDYAQGRKTAGGFGQSATFGLNQPAQSATSTFGQPAASTSAFGGFGQNSTQPQQNPTPQPASGFGGFGQPAASQPSAFGGGTGTSAFGTFGQNNAQPQQTPAPSVFGGGTGAFGQNANQQQPAPSAFGGGGTFGQNNQPKPFGTFGSTTAGTNAFGTGGAFGQSNQQPAQQTGTTGNAFGQPASQPQGTTSAFGSFGANNNNNLLKPSVFGQPANQQPTSGFGLFGQNNSQAQQPQQPSTGLFGGGTAGSGLFGQNSNQQQPQPGQPQNQTQPSTGLFGQPTNQPTTSGLFGGGGGTGLFGNNNQNKSAFGGGGLFGQNSQPANAGTTQPQPGGFSNPFGQSTAQPAAGTNAFGGSTLFGQKPPTTNMFGQSAAQPSTNGMGNSIFGGSVLGGPNGGFGASTAGTGGAQGAGMLTASVAQPVQTNLPIFSLLQSGARSTSLEPPPKKATSYFVDIPTRSPLGMSTSRLGGGGKLRGFGFSQSSAGLSRNSGLSSTMTLSSNAPSSPALSRGDGRGRNLLGPEAFLGNAGLGNDGKSSPKKLILDKKMDPSQVFGRSNARSASAADAKPTFNPAMSVAAREKELFSNAAPRPPPASPVPSASPGKKSAPLEKDSTEPQEGDYWVKPSLDVLRSLSNGQLSSFSGLVVGRKGFGEVQFLEPVDLTALPRLSALLGRLVEIDNQEVCVYPDAVEGDDVKPPPGEGINVRARIALLGCWPIDKATREPIKDEKHPLFIKHLKRLRNMKHTHFEGYVMKEGKWTFTVDHF
ncbi:nucleoporin autopeptidase-domain-containing protein [Phellopilus nigrolimitatus]|nr:nucleoporin autopeptidase-domain-containing protein [Phellopilus nigrolimitatus]